MVPRSTRIFEEQPHHEEPVAKDTASTIKEEHAPHEVHSVEPHEEQQQKPAAEHQHHVEEQKQEPVVHKTPSQEPSVPVEPSVANHITKTGFTKKYT
jgi:hypothetical protein